MRRIIQIILPTLAIFSLGVGIWQMLQTKTMILPSWFLVVISLPGTLLLSFALGFIVKKLLNSKWQILTFTSIFVIIFCSIFCISEYKPVYIVVIPKNYVGEIRLFLSNENENDFSINRYGIGYIDMRTFNDGFYPKIIQGGNDITKQIKEYSKGALATMSEDIYSFEYLTFYILDNGKKVEGKDIEELVKIKAIDTARLYKK
ncbi:hypothetical protein QFZ20_002199 [Flavobacterium sp. W4I14]|nr:hypothetical protein [Flavobacterium sp. W4I14]